MRSFRRRRTTVRTSRFESFEPRIVLSASAASELYLTDSVASIRHEVESFPFGAPDLSGLAQARADYGLTGAGQTVVVIDSGIAWRHEALGGGFGAGYRVVGGYDFAERDDNPYDDGPFGSHGTHVAGIIAGSGDQYAGLASGVDLVALRVFDDAGRGQFSWVEEALAWVHDHRNAFANPITTVNLSIGSEWNSAGLPAWAELEDELAQLEADGIFIAVAAGNSFTSYQQPGLSYPAASPYVVPVSSVDADGRMSYFSQRHDRAIAAPGRSIVSTVPDYLGNGNGIDDDFAAFSGTSMAAPYVAAASVLLRQAYQVVGIHNVNQDTLNNLMRSTADTLYDGATGQSYLRLNLERALDTLMPQDDFGSDSASAYDLGTIVDTLSISGVIGRSDDRDFFRFTAGSDGTATFRADAAGGFTPQWQIVGVESVQSAESVSFKVVAGTTYYVGLGSSSGVGNYTIHANLTSNGYNNDGNSNGATGGQSESSGNAVTAAGQWFTFSAVHAGIFTVEAFFDAAKGDVDLELFDAAGTFLAGSYGTSGYERMDATVDAGQTLHVHAWLNGPGTHDDVDLRVTNLVRQVGSSVVVQGTEGDDTFGFRAGSVLNVSINGVDYRFDGGAVQTVEFYGGGGNDTAMAEGTSGRDIARLEPGSLLLRGAGYRTEVFETESIVVRGDGNDLATLIDSAGDDVFRAEPHTAALEGFGFTNRVDAFGTVRAIASQGGTDAAYLVDSAGDDLFSAGPVVTVLRGQGFANYTHQFERVYAQATSGYDRAHLHDSIGDDTFVATPEFATLSGDGFSNTAANFDIANGHATSGGIDRAELYGSSGNDRLFRGPRVTNLSGDDFFIRARFFEDVLADGGAGTDVASLVDSGGNDRLAVDAAQLSLTGLDLMFSAEGFERVIARAARGGTDTAELNAVDLVLTLLGQWQ